MTGDAITEADPAQAEAERQAEIIAAGWDALGKSDITPPFAAAYDGIEAVYSARHGLHEALARHLRLSTAIGRESAGVAEAGGDQHAAALPAAADAVHEATEALDRAITQHYGDEAAARVRGIEGESK